MKEEEKHASVTKAAEQVEQNRPDDEEKDAGNEVEQDVANKQTQLAFDDEVKEPTFSTSYVKVLSSQS